MDSQMTMLKLRGEVGAALQITMITPRGWSGVTNNFVKTEQSIAT